MTQRVAKRRQQQWSDNTCALFSRTMSPLLRAIRHPAIRAMRVSGGAASEDHRAFIHDWPPCHGHAPPTRIEQGCQHG